MWPTDVVIKNRGYTNTQLLRTLEELCNNEDVCLAGAASMGKSFPVGLWIDLDWCAAPHCTSSWVATTNLGASEDRIWGIISKLWKCAKVQFGKLIDYRHMIVWGGASNDEDKDYRNAIKALAFQSGNEGQKAIDTTRGRKNDRIRVALDELPEMEMGAINIRQNLSSNDDKVFIGIGNPSAGDNPHTRWAMPKGHTSFDAVNAATFDIEASSLNASFGRLLCCCFKFQDEKDVRTIEAFRSKDEPRALEEVRAAWEEADIVAGWYSKHYDMRFLSAKMFRYNKPPLEMKMHIDMKDVHQHRFATAGHSLDAVAQDLRLPIQKYDVPREFWQLAVDGDKKAFQEIVKHCQIDVLITEAVLDRMRKHLVHITR